MEACPAVRVVEAATFEEPRGPRGRLVRAGPEDTHLPFDALVRDAAVVRDAAAGERPQLLEDLAWRAEREPRPMPQPARELADDPPVAPRFARRLDGLPDADDAAFGGRDRPLV